MKQLTIIIAIMLLFFGCSKDNDHEAETFYMKVTASYDTEIKGPLGDVLLFDVQNNHVNDYSVHYISSGSTEYYYLIDVNGERVFPSYKGDLHVVKDVESGAYKNESVCSIFSTELPLGVQNKETKNLLLVIDLDSSPFSYTTKLINWGAEDIELIKVFKSTSTEFVRHYEAW